MASFRLRLVSAACLAGALLLLAFGWMRDGAPGSDVPVAPVLESSLGTPHAEHHAAPEDRLEPLLTHQEAPDFSCDSPFDSDAFNDVVGLGRGAGGKGFRDPREHPYSTFSVDVDTASYTNVRRMLESGTLPPPEAVRVEELLNAFDYGYPGPRGEHPLALHAEVASSPWNPSARLLRIALQAGRVEPEARKPVNLVFLVDVSGSMQHPHKLPLVQAGLRLLVARLDGRDTVGIVTYASDVATALEPVSGDHREAILAVVDRLRAGGGTNGEGGIQRAYALAAAHARPGAESRVLLATDGDFNVGTSDRDALTALVAEKARLGVTLTVLGFGFGNLKDATLERLADEGDGHYAYVDDEREAQRLFGDGLAGTLVTAAQDVKLQVEFNPLEVQAYRLIGYANRALQDRDFADDAKDAGDVGVGHAVTALYEVLPHGVDVPESVVDPTRYQAWRTAPAAFAGELCTVKVRYKRPGESESTAFELPVRDGGAAWTSASGSFGLALAVTAFGEALARSAYAAPDGLDRAVEIALSTVREDPKGERAAFLDLALRARDLARRR